MSNLNKQNKRPTYQPKVKFQGNFTGEKEFIYDYTNPKGDFVSPGIKYFELSNGTYYEGENINNLATQIYKTKSEKTDNTYIININPPNVFSDIEIYDDISKREGRYDYNMYNVAKLKWGLLDGNIRSNKLQLRKLTQKGFFNLKFIFPNLSEFYLSTKTLQPKSLEEELSNPKLISNPKSESETGITESNPQIASIQQNVIDKIKDKTRKSKDKRIEKMLLKIRNNAKIKSTTNSPLKKSKTKQQNLGNSRGSGGNTSGGGGGGY